MPAKKIPIGLQLYSVRENCKEDLPGVLSAVAKMGYQGVEFAGYYNFSAKDLKKMLDDNGLKCCGTHTKLETLMGDELKKTMEFNKVLKNKYLIVPGLAKERKVSRTSWIDTAKLMNEISDKVTKEGFVTGYHNHWDEFAPVEGGDCAWDLFFGNTKKAVVMQVDTGNALRGNCDVVPFVSKYPGRALTVHLKEHAANNDKALIGEGQVDWPTCFKLCETVGATEWYIVEQESYAHPPMECVDLCLKKLRAMGK